MKNNLKYDAVFYDFDGTLGDSIPVILESFRGAYIEVFGECTRTEEDFKSYIGLPLVDTFKMHDEEAQGRLLEAYRSINHKLLEANRIPLFPGVIEGLEAIKALGVKQGIVTSKRIQAFEVTARLTGIWDYFDVIICKDDTRYHKPNADPLIEAARRSGITDYKRILYVGDALPDICCAQNAGTDFAFVNWSKMPKDDILFMKPDYCINQLKEISCIIDNIEL